MENNLEDIAEWKKEIVVEVVGRYYPDLEKTSDVVVDIFSDRVIAKSERPLSMKAYEKLSRDQILLINFRNKPYALRLKETIYDEGSHDTRYTISVYCPSKESPIELKEEINHVVSDSFLAIERTLSK